MKNFKFKLLIIIMFIMTTIGCSGGLGIVDPIDDPIDDIGKSISTNTNAGIGIIDLDIDVDIEDVIEDIVDPNDAIIRMFVNTDITNNDDIISVGGLIGTNIISGFLYTNRVPNVSIITPVSISNFGVYSTYNYLGYPQPFKYGHIRNDTVNSLSGVIFRDYSRVYFYTNGHVWLGNLASNQTIRGIKFVASTNKFHRHAGTYYNFGFYPNGMIRFGVIESNQTVYGRKRTYINTISYFDKYGYITNW